MGKNHVQSQAEQRKTIPARDAKDVENHHLNTSPKSYCGAVRRVVEMRGQDRWPWIWLAKTVSSALRSSSYAL